MKRSFRMMESEQEQERSQRWVYRRQGSPTIYARDREGRYACFQIQGQRVLRLPSGISTLPPIYGRVNFANNVRFGGQVPDQQALAARFSSGQGRRLSTGWVQLPPARSAVRRPTNQGMNPEMIRLTGSPYSATEYVNWCIQQIPPITINANDRSGWEWCHLLAHSMGGADNHMNIVAAVRGNNSEQLAIENALQMYRLENIFEMNISVVCINNGNALYIGDVIKYEIRSRHGGNNLIQYLDCLNAPNPSQIHFYDLLQKVARWANFKLREASRLIYNNMVTAQERDLIINYIENQL